jgi:hypothetical protein
LIDNDLADFKSESSFSSLRAAFFEVVSSQLESNGNIDEDWF